MSIVNQKLAKVVLERFSVARTWVTASSIDHHAWEILVQVAQGGQFLVDVLRLAEVYRQRIRLDEEQFVPAGPAHEVSRLH